MNRKWTWLVMLSGLVLVAAACGDDGDTGGDDDDDDDMLPIDGGPDSGPPEVDCWGEPCAGDGLTECPGSPAAARFCFAQNSTDYGGRENPTVNSDGTTRDVVYTETFWENGYCTLVDQSGTPTCQEDADCSFTGCAGRCLGVGNGLTGCFRGCDPGRSDNDNCRDGYQCDLSAAACVSGCRSDDECRVALEDTNNNGLLDAYDFGTNPNGDRWVYDLESTATCNTETFRCDNPGTEGVTAGDPCERSSQCMEDGTCILEESGFPGGGYCVKTNCDGFGRSCGEGEVCQAKGFGGAACLLECEFAAELDGATPENPFPEAAFQGGIGCREGYKCEWIGTADPVTGRARTEGACLPGTYNDVRDNNMGATCNSDDDCFSPLGNGFCNLYNITSGGVVVETRGECSLRDCSIDGGTLNPPGIPGEDVYCNTGNQCFGFNGGTQCFVDCDTADECAAGFACNGSLLTGTNPPSLCFIDCIDRASGQPDSSFCRTGEVCSAGGLCQPE